MRALQWILLTIGIVCLGTYGFFTLQAHFYQSELESEFRQQIELRSRGTEVDVKPRFAEGDLVGRLEIPRLHMSVMVMEGTADRTLRLGAGHIMGTSYPGAPGNAGIAAHRDTFFRDIRDIESQDVILFSTPRGTLSYRVASTEIVDPTDIDVLQAASSDSITLVTCFPFYYIGPAPKRFIVRANRDDSANAGNLLAQ